MFKPSPFLQACIGLSSIVLSAGGTWSMITGAIVKINVAGSNISVNSKLEKSEKIVDDLTETTEKLKSEASASPIRLLAIERELKSIDSDIDETEEKVREDLTDLLNQKGL